jgi:hypothetical protein
MYVHLCFAVSKEKKTLTDSVKPALQLHFESEDQFKSWMGQLLSNMLDLYRASEKENVGSSYEVDFEELCKDVKFLELKSWIESNLNVSNLTDLSKSKLMVSLGNSYARIVDLIVKYKIKISNNVVVDFLIDNELGDNDRKCEYIND